MRLQSVESKCDHSRGRFLAQPSAPVAAVETIAERVLFAGRIARDEADAADETRRFAFDDREGVVPSRSRGGGFTSAIEARTTYVRTAEALLSWRRGTHMTHSVAQEIR